MSGSQYLSIPTHYRKCSSPFVVEQSCIPCVPRIFACAVGPVYQFFLTRGSSLDFGSSRIRLYHRPCSAVGGQAQALDVREQLNTVFGDHYNPSVHARYQGLLRVESNSALPTPFHMCFTDSRF